MGAYPDKIQRKVKLHSSYQSGGLMAKIEVDSSWNEPPTQNQVTSLRKAWRALGYDFTEADIPPTRWEARNYLYDLWPLIRAKGKGKK